ncbi:MAG: DUF4352 domain-containing protein [Staphylothermus sp.]|nr:DUF4352 domain-containing protein [Staphylothermus sp.]
MKAISPVIATVIIVAVAIAISIAVALWITGLTSSFTGVEKLEVVNAYATYDDTNKAWEVHVIVKNTGTKTATIDQIFINNKPGTISSSVTTVSDGETSAVTSDIISLDTGSSIELIFYLEGEGSTITNAIVDDTFTSGQTVSIVIHTASGGQYPATVTLP